jgi:murein DD-endopeptidase MepM/ murein hydrolase activator NlpD
MCASTWFRRPVHGVGLAAAVVASFVLLLPSAAAAGGSSRRWLWPLEPRPGVVGPFDRPDSPYGAGNRGVDLAGSVGQAVLAIGSGVVAFAGVVAGRGVVVVSHGSLRSTYEPVSAAVAVGDTVRVGQPIGVLASVGTRCPPRACLHLGVIRGSVYVDPMSLLPDPPIRLKPLAGEPAAPAPLSSVTRDAAVAAAGYRWPTVR